MKCYELIATLIMNCECNTPPCLCVCWSGKSVKQENSWHRHRNPSLFSNKIEHPEGILIEFFKMKAFQYRAGHEIIHLFSPGIIWRHK